MKTMFYIENWETDDMIEVFTTENARDKFINEMCISIDGKDGLYLRYDTSTRIAISDF